MKKQKNESFEFISETGSFYLKKEKLIFAFKEWISIQNKDWVMSNGSVTIVSNFISHGLLAYCPNTQRRKVVKLLYKEVIAEKEKISKIEMLSFAEEILLNEKIKYKRASEGNLQCLLIKNQFVSAPVLRSIIKNTDVCYNKNGILVIYI